MTKELLAAILGDEYIDRVVEVISIEDNVLRTYYDCGSGSPTGLGLEYSLYELFFKCKEYIEEGEAYAVTIKGNTVYLDAGIYSIYGGFQCDERFTEESLIESMFACGQYILSQSAL